MTDHQGVCLPSHFRKHPLLCMRAGKTLIVYKLVLDPSICGQAGARTRTRVVTCFYSNLTTNLRYKSFAGRRFLWTLLHLPQDDCLAKLYTSKTVPLIFTNALEQMFSLNTCNTHSLNYMAHIKNPSWSNVVSFPYTKRCNHYSSEVWLTEHGETVRICLLGAGGGVRVGWLVCSSLIQ